LHVITDVLSGFWGRLVNGKQTDTGKSDFVDEFGAGTTTLVLSSRKGRKKNLLLVPTYVSSGKAAIFDYYILVIAFDPCRCLPYFT